jgi:hypothetical protein
MMKNGVRVSPLAGSSMIRELCGRKRLLDACYWLGVMDENGVPMPTCCLHCVRKGMLLRHQQWGQRLPKGGIQIEASCADRLVELLKQYGDEELASHILGLRRCPEEVSF